MYSIQTQRRTCGSGSTPYQRRIKPVLGGKGLANGHPPTRLGRRKDEAEG